jgi:E3 ubiquitin-protein ligase BOI-like protein
VEKRQRYLRSLLNVIEEGISRSLRDKDLEMEKVNRRNMELEERVKQLKLEAHLWQSKARNHEAMVATLKSNLQQAVVQSKEKNREGCGDNEADDVESAHVDPNAEVNYAKPLRGSKDPRDQITCKICRKNVISILLLPCRHLCLCRDCEMTFDTCHVCHAIKNASVEVYMS